MVKGVPNSTWIWVYRPGDTEFVYEMLCQHVPAPRRTMVRRLLRGAVMLANVALWLKSLAGT
tara:strand:- start:459 stop:644 length:186 start_codon:yes stop_codon:yes gene_type:complete